MMGGGSSKKSERLIESEMRAVEMNGNEGHISGEV